MESIKIPKIENVRMLDRLDTTKPPLKGCLYLTATHLIFVDPDNHKELWILHMHIATVQKLPITTLGSPIQLRCKNFLCVTFQIPKERDAMQIYESLLEMSQPTKLEELYCFQYTASNEGLTHRAAGWNSFDIQAEFYRQGVPNSRWKMTSINKDYEVCDTYPRHLFVPAEATNHTLYSSSKFRSRGRLPVLTYLHKNMASLTRCSQPLSGFKTRSLEDEEYLQCILRTNPASATMYIVDTRPMINAFANRATGKGYEKESHYLNMKFQFSNIENIHVMRSSLQKLIETFDSEPSMSAFLKGLDSSGWLKHIKLILDASAFIAHAIRDGSNVLVHCSDGWDRTAQTCSLACLLIDPYYRTINGFQALIEKEWLSFGHKFTSRCGFIQGDTKETSPVFTQFLDAVWQLANQFPFAFQFNHRFLLTIHDHVYSCQFGTFLGNCEKERLELGLNKRTFSLWGYLSRHISEFVNPLYQPDAHDDVLSPCLAPQAIKLWRGLYNRFENVHPREPLDDMLVATTDHINSLEDHNQLLEKRIKELQACLADVKTNGLPEKNPSSFIDPLLVNESGGGGDRPLQPPSFQQLVEEMGSVALDWASFRYLKECICSTPIDVASKKFHCWKCGEVFCIRCIDHQTPLPGHLSNRPVPVCRHCYKELTRSNSIDS